MKEPEKNPKVQEALKRWADFHKKEVPELKWDSMMGCWFFIVSGMFHGVELDGYIHT